MKRDAKRMLVLLLLAVAASSGCGNRRLVLNVDILSYLDPTVTRIAFGPVPPFPGGFYTEEQILVRDVEVNLVDGTNSISTVQNVSISMTAIAADSTGAGVDTLRLYLSDLGIDPLDTVPAVTLPITLVPGAVDTVRVDLGTDSRIAGLFSGKRMRLTLTTALRGPDSGDSLNASIRVSALDVVLVAGRKRDL